MIVRHLNELAGSTFDVDTPTWSSVRLLVKQDGAGFSLHDTRIKANTETEIWYKHHVEAVYCIEGEGEIEVLESGKVHPITPGTLYVLNGHEKHLLRGKSDMRMICVFNPPTTGQEVHDADGVYPLD
ncbi:ectoine synthase [Paenibacillus athensensis]|uniref:L-ectoine synthase n=1 Tax=Paenibacillus athensensis TaxID=1967502 RepID=A0A4Y8Q0A4_9BACL|nr:ectoine synthase [Paenibacillus athensensis]MCD1261086.1 ectoine synthase [Paenibacillus athensensis]